MENIEEIAATGIDVLWVGTSDLSASYGLPGQTEHPQVIEACERVVAACERNGITAGFPLRKLEDIAWAQEHGFRCLGYGTAESFVMQVSQEFLAAARKE